MCTLTFVNDRQSLKEYSIPDTHRPDASLAVLAEAFSGAFPSSSGLPSPQPGRGSRKEAAGGYQAKAFSPGSMGRTRRSWGAGAGDAGVDLAVCHTSSGSLWLFLDWQS